MRPNTPENVLPESLTEAALIESVQESGYPLQGVVAHAMQEDFDVFEEWGYVDRTTSSHRSLDVFGIRNYALGNNVLPRLGLLVECKKSKHPLVFFRKSIHQQEIWLPRVVGMAQEKATLYAPSGVGQNRVLLRTSPSRVLGLHLEDFITSPALCASFARAELKGKKSVLSGEDPYRNLMLPLIASTVDAQRRFPTENQRSASPVMLQAVAVVDAPMVLIESPSEVETPKLTTWIRLIRQEVTGTQNREMDFFAVDVVHASYFSTWLKDHLLEYAEVFANRMRARFDILRHGGYVDDLSNWNWQDVRARNAPP